MNECAYGPCREFEKRDLILELSFWDLAEHNLGTCVMPTI